MTKMEIAQITASNLEVASAFWSNYATHLSIYLSLLFGYCAAAYAAGRNLSTFQVATVSVMFVAAAELQIFSMVRFVSATVAVLNMTSEINPTVGARTTYDWTRVLATLLWQLGILGCLSFMWSIRRQTKQELR